MRTSLWISACALPEHLSTWGAALATNPVRCSRVNEMMGKIYSYTAKRDKQKLLDAFKVFDPDNTGRISVEMFEKEILQEIGEKMDDEKERADTMKNLEESGAQQGDDIEYAVFVDWVWTQLGR